MKNNIFVFSLFYFVFVCFAIAANAETFSYPVQEFRIGIANTNRNVVFTEGNLGYVIAVQLRYPNPFLKSIEVGSGKIGSVIQTNFKYTLKNVSKWLLYFENANE